MSDPEAEEEAAARTDEADAADDWRTYTPMFRAFDKHSGELVAEFNLPSHTDGSPISYMHDGKQYITFAIGGRGDTFEIVAYSLPE